MVSGLHNTIHTGIHKKTHTIICSNHLWFRNASHGRYSINYVSPNTASNWVGGLLAGLWGGVSKILNENRRGIEYDVITVDEEHCSQYSTLRSFDTSFTNFSDFWLSSARYEEDSLQVLSNLSHAYLIKIFHFSDEWKVVSVAP